MSALVDGDDCESDVVYKCAIPFFVDNCRSELPTCSDKTLSLIIQDNQDLFITVPGLTSLACHYIPTSGSSIRVPPRWIPAHYRNEVEIQIKDMLAQGIIEESASSWMVPAVFVKKKSGELRLCVDYRELNKRTSKDAYPLPLVDEVQDRLVRSTVFTSLDLRNGYWQILVHESDQHKTAFCPEPTLGLFQFN